MSTTLRLAFMAAILSQSVTRAASTSPAQPIVCTTSAQYVGYDGQWSPVTIRVGTPEQWLSVLPNTLSPENWLVGPAACDGTLACTTARGGLFYSNESSTFQDLGLFELGTNPQLGSAQSGYYGFDTIALNDDVSQPGQLVALLNTSDLWVGQMGLGVQQTRIEGSENTLPLLSSLVQNNGTIPSHSYGYTAGAAYRLKGVPASLTLGGVDTNRYVPNNVSFTLASDYAPAVAVNSISVSSGSDALPPNWNSNPISLLDQSAAAVFTIDSSTPYLWLPENVCDNFAQTLNLTYNETLELYVFGNGSSDLASPDILQNWNLTFSFELGNQVGSGPTVQIDLPYASFNLELTYGFPNFDGAYGSPPLPYFPVRRSADSSTYILGRAFLQESYLAADYERNVFNVYQALITEESVNNVNLSSITRPANSIFPGPDSRSNSTGGGLSTGAKAGIGAAAGVVAVLVGALALWWFVFRKQKTPATQDPTEKPQRRSIFKRISKSRESNTTVSELLGDRRHPTEVPADSSNSRFELPADNAVEMPAAEVSPTFFQNPDSRSVSGRRTDLTHRPENGQRRAPTKHDEAVANASERSASPVPPYSPTAADQRLSASVSPYSARHSQAFGTVSSAEQGVSPLGHGSSDGSQQSPISPEATMPRASQRAWPVHQQNAVQAPPSAEGEDDGQNPGSQGRRFSWQE